MIGSLRGSLIDRFLPSEVLVEVAGIGYRVTVAPTTAVSVGDVGDEVFLHVHHHVREDAVTLYGFLGRDERICFEALLGAHGVGPALALAILSVHSPQMLRRVLVDDDVAALCLVPGVGKKTAARLLVELKARLDVPELDLTAAATAASGNGNANGLGHGAAGRSPRSDVREALAELGYGPDEVQAAMAELPDEGDAAILLKAALQTLAVRA